MKYQVRRFGSEVILEEGIATGLGDNGGLLQFHHEDGSSTLLSPYGYDYITLEEVQ